MCDDDITAVKWWSGGWDARDLEATGGKRASFMSDHAGFG
jgi:hypothetical protein